MTENLDRRQFLGAAAALACGCLLGSRFTLAGTEEGVRIGTAADFPHDGVYEQFAQTGQFLVVREGSRLFAPSSACTHRGGTVRPKDGQLVCPYHNAMFGVNGKVKRGPARESLPHLRISKAADGSITVYPGNSFKENDWGDPRAFVELA